MNLKPFLFYSLKMIAVLILLLSFSESFAQKPVFLTQNIFPYQTQHVHGSSIVELPNGDLMAGWFQGSGERWADDVKIMGSRKKKGSQVWSKPFVLADSKEFPDCNPILFVDTKNRLWVMWYTVLANQWETSLIKYKISTNYQAMAGAPVWAWQDDLLIKPGDKSERGISPNDSFVASIKDQLEQYAKYMQSTPGQNFNADLWKRFSERSLSNARGENMKKEGWIYNADSSKHEVTQLGYPYFQRMGWQTKHKPVFTKTGRMIVPLYSDGFSFSLMAYTDDLGGSWKFSTPLVGPGNIQPAIAQTKSGELVAYMRDNGGAPKRLHISRSADNGKTWSYVTDTDRPNPGAGADIVTLKNGHWVLIYNDQENGRNKLAVALSEDEGKTWGWKKLIEDGPTTLSAHYPAIVQGKDGLLQISYSYFTDKGKTIKYAVLNEAWIKSK